MGRCAGGVLKGVKTWPETDGLLSRRIGGTVSRTKVEGQRATQYSTCADQCKALSKKIKKRNGQEYPEGLARLGK